MDSKDLLFDMWFLEAEENEKLKDDIEDLEDGKKKSFSIYWRRC